MTGALAIDITMDALKHCIIVADLLGELPADDAVHVVAHHGCGKDDVSRGGWRVPGCSAAAGPRTFGPHSWTPGPHLLWPLAPFS